MIVGARRAKPILTFGLGKFEAEIGSGQKIDFFLETPYLQNQYTFFVITDVRAEIEKVNDNHWTFEHLEPDQYEIRVQVSSKELAFSMTSNPITINVI